MLTRISFKDLRFIGKLLFKFHSMLSFAYNHKALRPKIPGFLAPFLRMSKFRHIPSRTASNKATPTLQW